MATSIMKSKYLSDFLEEIWKSENSKFLDNTGSHDVWIKKNAKIGEMPLIPFFIRSLY